MTILVATDESPGPSRAVRVGYDLASAFDDPLLVVHVVPDDFSALAYDHDQLDVERGLDAAEKREQAAAFAKSVADRTLDDPDDRVEAAGRVGAPVQEILAAADEADARYLVVGGTQRSPTGKAVFGSTTQSLLLRSDRPVVTAADAAATGSE
ncbi:MAG: universal stress protein [Haloarculaceae archaeon]